MQIVVDFVLAWRLGFDRCIIVFFVIVIGVDCEFVIGNDDLCF